MFRYALFILFVFFVLPVSLFAQGGIGININGSPAHNSAMVDVSSTDRGMLIPRMTQAQRDAISNPAEGLEIYNTDTKCYNFYNGAIWRQSCYECSFSLPAVSSNAPLCEGGTLELGASAISGATYSWTGPNNFTSSSQNPVINNVTATESGTYHLQVSANGCTTPAIALLVKVEAPLGTLTAGSSGPVCEDSTLQLTASSISGATYSWTGPNGFSSNDQNPVLPGVDSSYNGLYKVTAEKNGCISPVSQVNISITPAPSSAFTWSPLIPATGVSVAFSPDVSGAASYSWTFASGSPASSSAENPSVSWAAPGNYNVQLGITDNNGCSSTTDLIIMVSNQLCSVSGNANTLAGPYAQYGFCWYLGKGGLTCDQVCNGLSGGSNLANSATGAFPDNCNAAAASDITTYFFNNGNPAGWTTTGATGYHTLGYGYLSSNYYGKCASGGNTSAGTFPGESSNNNNRTNVCPCFQY